MSVKNNELVSILNDLIEVCKDGEQGYKNASDDVKDVTVKQILLKYSEQRGRFYSELQYIVKKMGGEVEFGGSILGVLHRRWMDIKFGIAGSRTEAILNECVRGEKAAISTYKKYLNRELPDTIRQVVERQNSEINEALQGIIQLSFELGFELKTSI